MDAIGTINITFDRARLQASKVLDCASQIRDIERQVDMLRGNLQREWDGDAARAFMAKCDVVEDNIIKSAVDCLWISDAIRGAANAYYTAEMRALEIANSRG